MPPFTEWDRMVQEGKRRKNKEDEKKWTERRVNGKGRKERKREGRKEGKRGK